MSILIVGGLGYIGSNVAKSLLLKDEDVIIMDNLSNSHIGKAKLIKESTDGKTIKLYGKDLLKEKDIIQVFKENQIESVIYTATSTSKDSSKYILENIQMLSNLLEVMKTFTCKRLIFTSSDIYEKAGQVSELDYTIDPIKVTDKEAVSNLLLETYLNKFYKDNQNENWSIAILRLFEIAGTDSSGLLGNFNLQRDNIFTKIMKNNLKNEPILIETNYPTYSKTLIKDYTHIRDCVVAYQKALNLVRKSANYFDLFNIGSGKPTTDLQIMNMYNAISGTKVPFTGVKKSSERIAERVNNKIKMINTLKYEETLGIDAIIRSNIEFCSNYGQIQKDYKEAEKMIQKANRKSEKEKEVNKENEE